MSWSATVAVSPDVEGFEIISLSNVDEVPAHVEQYAAALVAAAEILVSGTVGSPNKKYLFNLSGHANPDHEPVEGTSNDFVTIGIVQVSEETQ